MNIDEVKEIVSLINSSDIKNFELTIDNAVIKISKSDNAVFSGNNNAATAAVQNTEASAVNPGQNTAIAIQPTTAVTEIREVKKGGNLVKAPIVGTFYDCAGPGKPPYVSVGSKVKKGDVLCIIEAMKIMNEVVSEFDGEVSEILAKPEELVEYGQVLFRIV